MSPSPGPSDTPSKPPQTPLSDALRAARQRHRREYKSPDRLAREQALVDWLEAPLPIDEHRGICHINDTLIKLLPRLKLEQAGAIQKEQLIDGWKRAAGDFISNNAELVSLKNGVALVKVLQPTLRYHLTQWTAPLLEKLRKEFGEKEVVSIKFIFG